MAYNYTIVNTGMGGFLNPPEHAEHNYSVQLGSRDSMSLTYALTCAYVSEGLKTAIRTVLELNPGKPTEEWIQSCYSYFRHCYSPDGINRSCSDCIVLKPGGDPLPAEHHLAYLHVRSFVPDHTPRTDLF